MFNKFPKWLQDSTATDLEKAVIISILVGIIITSVLILEKKEESFSSFYIYPGSYTNYPAGDTTSFTYGVRSYEKETMGYDLEVFIGNMLADKKHFEIKPGQTYEDNETVKIPDMGFPLKVDLVLKSPLNTYSTHYWLMRPKETQLPVETPTPVATPETESLPAFAPDTTPAATPNHTPTPVPTPAPTATPAYISTPDNTSSSGSTPANTSISTQISIDARRGFSPKEVSIKAGESVLWTNRDQRDATFTLASREDLFTRVIDVERGFVYTFNTTGTYNFYIKEFPNSTGIVKVG